ncbi:MAG: hypothetical protein LC708_00920, partial [Actinobacteria bacterium]|nr:hypothetical protein [Actinomycetota bacterium]
LQVRPGEEITWDVRVVNRGREGVSNVSAEGLIPQGTRYVAGSAGGAGTSVQYSIDGGRTFSPRPTVVVEGREVPASPDAYTNVRFTWPAAVAPGAPRAAQYRTRVL